LPVGRHILGSRTLVSSNFSLVAFRLLCGIDLSEALAAAPGQAAEIIRRVERLVERERLKGLRRHWAYDLNRHIALKQALDQLREEHSQLAHRRSPAEDKPWKKDGARKRRLPKNLSSLSDRLAGTPIAKHPRSRAT
jgi:hypothetical protein